MKTPIRVLLVDDKEDYCQSLSGAARHENIQIVYKLDWETGFEVLQNDLNIEFVILDGKGKIEADQETEKDNFVMRAINDIKAYSNKIGKHIPFCVNTGFIDSFEVLDGNEEIFEKNEEDREKMFNYILKEVKNSEYRTLRMSFDEAFKVFDMGIINKRHESLLLEVLKAYNNKDYRKSNMTIQRDLLEAIFISLNNLTCIPIELFNQNDLPIHEWCTRFLEGRPTRDSNGVEHRLDRPIPQSIKSAFRKLRESTNEYSHLKDEAIVKMPFLANTFLLLEILEWLPIFAKENYESYI